MSAPTVASSRPVLRAVIEMLAPVTGKGIGDGKAPNPATGVPLPETPYAYVLGAGGVQLDGPPWSDHRHADGYVPFQVNCVGGGEQGEAIATSQAEWMADAVRVAMLDKGAGRYLNALDVFGFSVMERDYLGSGPPIAEGKLVTIAEQFGCWITPRG